MRPLPPVPASVSIRVAGHVLGRSRNTIVRMLARGDLAHADDGHIAIGSIDVWRGSPVTPEQYSAALALRAAGGKRK